MRGMAEALYTQFSLSLHYRVALHVDRACVGELVFFAARRNPEMVRGHYFFAAGALFSLSGAAARAGSMLLVPAGVLHGTLKSAEEHEVHNRACVLIGSALTTKAHIFARVPTAKQVQAAREEPDLPRARAMAGVFDAAVRAAEGAMAAGGRGGGGGAGAGGAARPEEAAVRAALSRLV